MGGVEESLLAPTFLHSLFICSIPVGEGGAMDGGKPFRLAHLGAGYARTSSEIAQHQVPVAFRAGISVHLLVFVVMSVAQVGRAGLLGGSGSSCFELLQPGCMQALCISVPAKGEAEILGDLLPVVLQLFA